MEWTELDYWIPTYKADAVSKLKFSGIRVESIDVSVNLCYSLDRPCVEISVDACLESELREDDTKQWFMKAFKEYAQEYIDQVDDVKIHKVSYTFWLSVNCIC